MNGPIVLEERLTGPECSLLAVCDGRTAKPLPMSQDHKRIFEGDTGPNTGGMGAYAPAPIPYDADELTQRFVQPVLDHFAAKGQPYVGVLYAGLMLTADGPKLLEFNCRFGDPETQAILPMLTSSLLDPMLAVARGARIGSMPGFTWRAGASVTTVVASPGYPDKPLTGRPIELPSFSDAVRVYHAGTSRAPGGQLQTSGGRVARVVIALTNAASASASKINDLGQITGMGRHFGVPRAYLLTPVDAP